MPRSSSKPRKSSSQNAKQNEKSEQQVEKSKIQFSVTNWIMGGPLITTSDKVTSLRRRISEAQGGGKKEYIVGNIGDGDGEEEEIILVKRKKKKKGVAESSSKEKWDEKKEDEEKEEELKHTCGKEMEEELKHICGKENEVETKKDERKQPDTKKDERKQPDTKKDEAKDQKSHTKKDNEQKCTKTKEDDAKEGNIAESKTCTCTCACGSKTIGNSNPKEKDPEKVKEVEQPKKAEETKVSPPPWVGTAAKDSKEKNNTTESAWDAPSKDNTTGSGWDAPSATEKVDNTVGGTAWDSLVTDEPRTDEPKSKDTPKEKKGNVNGKGKDWTKEQDDKLREMKKANKSQKELNKEFNRNKPDIDKRWEELQKEDSTGNDDNAFGDGLGDGFAGGNDFGGGDSWGATGGGDWGNLDAANSTGGAGGWGDDAAVGDSAKQTEQEKTQDVWISGGNGEGNGNKPMDIDPKLDEEFANMFGPDDPPKDSGMSWTDVQKLAKKHAQGPDASNDIDSPKKYFTTSIVGNGWDIGDNLNTASSKKSSGNKSNSNKPNKSNSNKSNEKHNNTATAPQPELDWDTFWASQTTSNPQKAPMPLQTQAQPKYKSSGKLQRNDIWGDEDCNVLEELMKRHHEHKWLNMQAQFFNWTGRMISAEMIEKKFKDDGACD